MAHVVGEVFHPDLGLRAHDADHAHQRADHVVGLRTEDMLDPGTYRRLGPVAGLALFGQRLAPLALAVDVALQPACAEPGFHLLGPIGRICPDACTGVALHQQMIHHLAVMQRRIADVVTADQLVLAVHVHVVLIAVVALACFFVQRASVSF